MRKVFWGFLCFSVCSLLCLLLSALVALLPLCLCGLLCVGSFVSVSIFFWFVSGLTWRAASEDFPVEVPDCVRWLGHALRLVHCSCLLRTPVSCLVLCAVPLPQGACMLFLPLSLLYYFFHANPIALRGVGWAYAHWVDTCYAPAAEEVS